jgi:peptide/nickel transport system permease protein
MMTPEERSKAWRLLKRNPVLQASILIVLLMILIAVVAPLLPLADPERQNLRAILRPPMWSDGGLSRFPLGTDFLGRDVLSRLVWGARVSIGVGFAAVAVAALIGVSLGLVAPYFGGWTDELIMRGFDIVLSIPHLLIAIAVLLVLGQSLPILIVVLGIRSTVWYARTLRSRVLSIREEQYVKAARALGASDITIMTRHVLRNAIAPVLVLTSIYVGLMVIVESSLSFLGLTRGYVSWGFMIAESRNYLATSWWTATLPGLCIVFLVLSMNIIGDFLRDVFDPRLQVRGH